jgi:hypothetical protein
MKTIFLVACFGALFAQAHAQNCADNTHRQINGTQTGSSLAIKLDGSKTPEPAQLGCAITLDQWRRQEGDSTVVWDVRGRLRENQNRLDGANRMSHAATRAAAVLANQSLLLVDDSLDSTAAFSLCTDLHQRSIRAYVLSGGDRAWHSHQTQRSANERRRSAELSVSEAAMWIDDANTEWIEIDSIPVSKRSLTGNGNQSRTESSDSVSTSLAASERRILLISPPNAQPWPTDYDTLLDDRTWWVAASRSTIEASGLALKSVALQRGKPLNKPCGVN